MTCITSITLSIAGYEADGMGILQSSQGLPTLCDAVSRRTSTPRQPELDHKLGNPACLEDVTLSLLDARRSEALHRAGYGREMYATHPVRFCHVAMQGLNSNGITLPGKVDKLFSSGIS
nr:hypothetical protein CFP56_58827 [Quercus suber]